MARDDLGVADLIGLDELREIGIAAGLDVLGVASAAPFLETQRTLESRRSAGLHAGMQFTYRNPRRSTHPEATMPGAATLLVGALSYRHAAPEAPPGAGPQARVARYVWADHYGSLRNGLEEVAARLRSDGWRAEVVVDENNLVDRAAAHRAGLGWFGKNSNLLLPGHGSWFVLGSVVTDAPLAAPVDDAAVPDGCGTCTRCIDGCPTGAIVAPGVVDARRCLAWSLQATGAFPREQRVPLHDRIYGCDDCQEVCPPNRLEDRRADDAAAVEPGAAWVPVLEMLAMSDEALIERFGHWYVPRRETRYLRRNALVVLGNTADPRSEPGAGPGGVLAPDDGWNAPEASRACLSRYLRDPDPMLRAHAAWAARRLGWTDLVEVLADDPAPEVQEELLAPPPPVRVG